MINRLGELLLKRGKDWKNQPISAWQLTGFISFLVTACLFLLNEVGSFQILEWVILDRYFQLRPDESTEPRLLIVTVDEPDISALQQWPLTDEKLYYVLRTIEQYEPRVIGLDLYRDFPIAPGEELLASFFKNTPHLIGVEKVGGTPVPPPPILAEQGQVALADIVMDSDGTVRRALLTARDDQQEKWTLGAAIALQYLAGEGISIDNKYSSELTLSTGISFPRLLTRKGGYTHVDNRGYQVFLNYRGPDNSFDTVSIRDVLAGQVSEHLIRDRIVLIGSIAPSINDFIYTPYSYSSMTGTSQSPGVAVHAHIASMIMSTALDGRSLIRSWPTIVEWAWVYLWCVLGSGVILIPNWQGRNSFAALVLMMVPVLGLGTGVLVVNGILFVGGWWVPSIPALFGIMLSATISLTSSNLKLIKDVYTDGLTEVLNRKAFNQYLIAAEQQSKEVSIILCDIDYFKGYNDFYGHPAGDGCLKQAAKTIQQAVRSQDIVARYGGEEFAVILQNTTGEKACEIAERMRHKVQCLQIPHEVSQVSPYVSISCGVATRTLHKYSPLTEILSQADKALYESKRGGRNKVSLYKESHNQISN